MKMNVSIFNLPVTFAALLFTSCTLGGTRSASPKPLAAADTQPVILPPTLTLSWEYPLVFRVYASDDVAAPRATWPLVTNIVVTNFSFTIPATGAQQFFTMRAVMLQGGLESEFSNIATNFFIAK